MMSSENMFDMLNPSILQTESGSNQRSAAILARSDTAYRGLLYTLFQQLRSSTSNGVIVALTSANSGEGVTHSITALINILSKDGATRILRLDAHHLSEISVAPQEISQYCQQIDSNLYEFVGGSISSKKADLSFSWVGNWKYRGDCIEEFRKQFDYVLIDCPAINAAGDVLSLAPLVDGVIMIIQADRTRIDQIHHAEKSIQFARGKLIGHIFNKRTFHVPTWLYKRL